MAMTPPQQNPLCSFVLELLRLFKDAGLKLIELGLDFAKHGVTVLAVLVGLVLLLYLLWTYVLSNNTKVVEGLRALGWKVELPKDVAQVQAEKQRQVAFETTLYLKTTGKEGSTCEAVSEAEHAAQTAENPALQHIKTMLLPSAKGKKINGEQFFNKTLFWLLQRESAIVLGDLCKGMPKVLERVADYLQICVPAMQNLLKLQELYTAPAPATPMLTYQGAAEAPQQADNSVCIIAYDAYGSFCTWATFAGLVCCLIVYHQYVDAFSRLNSRQFMTRTAIAEAERSGRKKMAMTVGGLAVPAFFAFWFLWRGPCAAPPPPPAWFT